MLHALDDDTKRREAVLVQVHARGGGGSRGAIVVDDVDVYLVAVSDSSKRSNTHNRRQGTERDEDLRAANQLVRVDRLVLAVRMEL